MHKLLILKINNRAFPNYEKRVTHSKLWVLQNLASCRYGGVTAFLSSIILYNNLTCRSHGTDPHYDAMVRILNEPSSSC